MLIGFHVNQHAVYIIIIIIILFYSGYVTQWKRIMVVS